MSKTQYVTQELDASNSASLLRAKRSASPSLALLGAALAVLTCVAGARAPSTAATTVPQSTWPPPIEVFHSIETFDLFEHIGRYYVVGRVSVAARQRKVDLAFSANRTGPREHPLATSAARIETPDFTPTAAAVLDSNHLAVGGHSQDGVTFVEIWSVSTPAVTAGVDASTGARTYSLSEPVVEQRQRVWFQNSAGRRGVRRLVKLRGKPSSLLIQFHDSRDLFELDHSTSPASLRAVFAAHAGSATPVLPDLLHDDLRSTLAARHKSRGYIYIFAPTVAPDAENKLASPEVALIDQDYDGVIDVVAHPSKEERILWADEGYEEWGLATRF